MARLGSRQIAGFFACPIKVVRAIGALLRHDGQQHGRMNIVDPCAGDGEAVAELAAAIERTTVKLSDSNIFACELEAGRAAALERRLRTTRRPERGVAVHSDAFRMRWGGSGASMSRCLLASVGYFNPPYDTDPEFGRTEERWLRHFLPILNEAGGVLVFVIPITALTASIDTIAKHFSGVTVYRFPDPYYEAFKQIVVIAKRRKETYRPDAGVVAMLSGFAVAPETIPILPMGDTTPIFMVPTVRDYDAQLSHVQWERRPLDADVVAEAIRPWRFGDKADRQLPGVLPENGVKGYTSEHFTVALPLKPGHVAPALAVGVFDGIRVVPDDKASGLPPVFAKATFVKDWSDVEGGVRTNENGDVISILQVQQPRLIMTALDLRRGKYVKIESSLARRSSTDLEQMTVADFLAAYNKGLLATLKTKCTPLFDPEDPNRYQPNWNIARPLWQAQVPATTAALLCIEKYGAGLIEGETGTGKTSCGTAIASALRCKRSRGRIVNGARRTVIVCPPHLLAEWLDEIAVVRPDATATVIHDVAEADAFASSPDEKVTFGILAETTGKLAHGRAGVGDEEAQPVHVEVEPNEEEQGQRTRRQRRRGAEPPLPTPGPMCADRETQAHRDVYLSRKKHRRACPACGAWVEPSAKEVAAKRARCEARDLRPTNDLAHLVQAFARVLAPVMPNDEAVTGYLRGHLWSRMRVRWQAESAKDGEQERRWQRARRAGLVTVTRRAVGLAVRGNDNVREQLLRLIAAVYDDELTAWAARALFEGSLWDTREFGVGASMRDMAALLLSALTDLAMADALLVELKAKDPEKQVYSDRWGKARERIAVAHGKSATRYYGDVDRTVEGPLFYRENPGSIKLAYHAFEGLRRAATFEEGEPCGEPLFAAVPRPRRVPLAHYLAHRWRHRIDLVIIDEIHENGAKDSAQTQAMEQFRGRPMLGLTGTISNGYVASLFAILRCFSPRFRLEFGRDDFAPFRERYGYLKRILQDVDKETGSIVAFGTQSNRVQRKMKPAGDAPGALPSFILRHFLPLAAPIHLEDLEVGVPPAQEIVEMIDPGDLLGSRVQVFVGELMDQIKADRFTPMQGKLFGAMGEAWSVADRASLGVGNSEDGIYRAVYPESVGGAEVCRLEMMPADFLLPKEQRLIEIVRRELGEDRNVLILAWHADCGLYERLATILKEALGVETPILYSEKPKARDRKAWLKTNVVGKARTMIVNPACIETGFNALTWFNTMVWFQPPGCNPKTMRQAKGRVRRPGQTKEQRFYWLIYQNTLQVALHQLLQLKAAESMAIDGTDNTAALRAAGVEPVGGVGGFDLGRALYEAAQSGRWSR